MAWTDFLANLFGGGSKSSPGGIVKNFGPGSTNPQGNNYNPQKTANPQSNNYNPQGSNYNPQANNVNPQGNNALLQRQLAIRQQQQQRIRNATGANATLLGLQRLRQQNDAETLNRINSATGTSPDQILSLANKNAGKNNDLLNKRYLPNQIANSPVGKNPVVRGAANVAKDLTVGLPITVGQAFNKSQNLSRQQKDAQSAMDAANAQESQTWKDYRAGKIDSTRAANLIADAYKQRNQANQILQQQTAKGPSAKDAALALGGLGLGAVGAGARALGTAGKAILGAGGVAAGVNQAAQIPGQIKNIKNLKGSAKTQAITEAGLSDVLGAVAGVAGGKALAGAGREAFGINNATHTNLIRAALEKGATPDDIANLHAALDKNAAQAKPSPSKASLVTSEVKAPQGQELMKALGSKNPEAAQAQQNPLLEDLAQGNKKAIQQNVNREGVKENAKLSLPTPKPEDRVIKSTASKGTLIGRQSPEAKALINRQITNKAQYAAQLKEDAKPFLNLSDSEAERVAQAKEAGGAGVTKLQSQKEQQALEALHPQTRAIAEEAAKRGVLHGDLGETYFPRMTDWSKLPEGSKSETKFLEKMVNDGHASDLTDARAQLRDIRTQDLAARKAGNLEFHRTAKLPLPQLPAKQRYQAYLDQAANRITQAKHFGANNENLEGHVSQAMHEGKDWKTLQDAISKTINPKPGSGSKALRRTREGLAVVQLPKAAISHLFQTINNTMDAGYGRTIAGWVQSISRQARTDARLSGALEDIHGINKQSGVEGVLSKFIAPGLRFVMERNRTASALTGRMYANKLAAKGNVARLKELGVSGPIGSKLTAQQMKDAMYGYTGEKMFRSTPMDTPLWAESEAGKLVGQYRLAYSYKETGLLYNKVIKEAAKGNVVPLLRMAAIIPLAGEGARDLKGAISGTDPHKDEKKVWDRLAGDTAAVVGLPGEAYNNLKYGLQGGRQALSSAASAVAPAAGTVVQAGQAVKDSEQAGTPKAVEKYAVKQIPYVGSRAANKLFGKAPDGAVQYGKDVKGAIKGADQNTKDYVNAILGKMTGYKDGQPAKIGKAPDLKAADAKELASNPDALSRVKAANAHSTDPLWKLPVSGKNGQPNLETYFRYQGMDKNNFERQVILDKNPWIIDLAKKRGEEFTANPIKGGNTVQNPLGTHIDVPKGVQPLLDQMSGLEKKGDTTGVAKLIAANPDLGKYLNDAKIISNRTGQYQGGEALNLPKPASKDLENFMNQYSNASKGQKALLKSSPLYAKMVDFYTNSSVNEVAKSGALMQYKSEQGNTANTQKFLKGVYNLGQMDVTKNSDGTFSLNKGQSSGVSVSPALAKSIDEYDALPKGSNERRAYLKSHPELIDYWNKVYGSSSSSGSKRYSSSQTKGAVVIGQRKDGSFVTTRSKFSTGEAIGEEKQKIYDRIAKGVKPPKAYASLSRDRREVTTSSYKAKGIKAIKKSSGAKTSLSSPRARQTSFKVGKLRLTKA